MNNDEILKSIKGGLIVSCQALPDEPLHSSYIMSRMAYAAAEGGAKGIRANTVEDITEIKRVVSLPIIGIIKKVFDDSDVYITPTLNEVDALCECGVEIIAVDATNRKRPGGESLADFFKKVREKYPHQLFMADTSCFEEGKTARELGFDIVGTTMSGYTEYTRGRSLPDFELMERYVTELDCPVIAEGGIWTPEQLKTALNTGVHCAVVGTAITRPREITRKFAKETEGSIL
ncbi:MAG: N-acetylmannosamine-6-phosphate 2-epimerase [Oscillospiraceae bacterium]|nr:N-acetylmannosamine-6-phosphate 2-epimerase [Oscillospiraceae bacterium]